jgi:Holliday junction resolvasome RuvABC ATP-dependent DNA helicase subunit
MLMLYWPLMVKYTQEDVRDLLAGQGIDSYGLGPQQRLYLLTLYHSHNGTSSLTRLAVTLGYDTAFVLEDVEPFLICRKWVGITDRGRHITAEGRAVAVTLPDIAHQPATEEDVQC